MSPYDPSEPRIAESAEQVILVDADDRPVGTAPKLEAHRRALMHRAFSVIVRDGAGRLLLQRRARGKYHSPGLWSNSCCGHPRPGEDLAAGAGRRLHEELGFSCPLTRVGRLHYAVDFQNGLSENEVVTLFVGRHEGAIPFDPAEVEEVAWVALPDLQAGIAERPNDYTYWFRLYVTEHLEMMRAGLG